jgi:uncharacterized protein YgiB involved in biofilm formation
MTLPRTARRTLPALAAASLLGLAGCGEDDVERNVEEGAKETREAGRDAKKAGEDAAREAEKQANEAERDLEN